MEIRHVFFSVYKKFLVAAFTSIREDAEDPENMKDYWDMDEFYDKLMDIDESFADPDIDAEDPS